MRNSRLVCSGERYTFKKSFYISKAGKSMFGGRHVAKVLPDCHKVTLFHGSFCPGGIIRAMSLDSRFDIGFVDISGIMCRRFRSKNICRKWRDPAHDDDLVSQTDTRIRRVPKAS